MRPKAPRAWIKAICTFGSCNQLKELEPDTEQEPRTHLNPQDKMVRSVSYPMRRLLYCYYHNKMEAGLFEANPQAELRRALRKRKL